MNPSPVHPTRKTKTTMARFCVIADRHMMSALHIMFLVWCLHVVLLQTVIQSLNQRVNSEKVVPLVCDKLQLIWTGDFQSLKRFMQGRTKTVGGPGPHFCGGPGRDHIFWGPFSNSNRSYKLQYNKIKTLNH